MAKFGGLPWDLVLATEVFKHYKPDPETYLGAAQILDLEPGQVMMVAAHANDLASAAALGLRTGYIYRPFERGKETPLPKPDTSAFDVSVDSMEELASALGV